MSTITILKDNVTVLTIEGTIVGHPEAGASAPVNEPGGDYSTNLEAPGGHGHKFRPGKTEFSILGVAEGTTLEFSIVAQGQGGDSSQRLSGPNGVVNQWTLPGSGNLRTEPLPAGDYTLLVDAPSYGEINHWRHA